MVLFRRLRALAPAIGALCLAAMGMASAAASPGLVVDVGSGEVLYQTDATVPWFPASTTKLMTVYVALSAVREGRITLDTPLMVSPRAAVMPPSKMGFRPGTLVTLDNALKMLMVKSPNDVAVTIAEGVSGSVEAFADDMNVYATRLGLHESHFINPNGLPDDRHFSSARDMAMIGRALLRDFPEERGLFGIGVLAFGRQLINNHNGLLGRYPGVDGMKTGYTCAAGYNVVESAEQNGRHLLVVIMGAPSTAQRNERAASLFDRFLFGGAGTGLGRVEDLRSSDVTDPPDNHDTICGRGRRGAIAEAEQEDAALISAASPDPAGQGGAGSAVSHLLPTRIAFEPVRVSIGPAPGWTGRVAQAVGAGAKEMVPSPVKSPGDDAGQPPVEQASATDGTFAGSPVEAPAPAPLALVGAMPIAPAALATRRLVRSAPGLSLAVRRDAGPKHRPAAAAGRPVAKPQAVAAVQEAAPGRRPGPKVARKVAAVPAHPSKSGKAAKKKP